MEITNLPDTEFKTIRIVTRMLKKLRQKMDELSEILNKETVNIKKDIETVRRNQSEIKTISEMKNTLEGISIRSDEEENQISNLKDNVAQNAQSKHQKKFFLNEYSLSPLEKH